MSEREKVARAFHDAYERLAPQFGYETREDTREFDPQSPNGQLMMAVCGEVTAPASVQDAARVLLDADDLDQHLRTENGTMIHNISVLCECLRALSQSAEGGE